MRYGFFYGPDTWYSPDGACGEMVRPKEGTAPDQHDAKATAAPNRDGTFSRSRRGSAWTDEAWASRSALRQRFEPERRYDHIVFRVVAVQR